MSPATLLWVFIGGGIGASLRFIFINVIARAGINNFMPAFSHGFFKGIPIAVLLINIIGSFAIGVFAQIVSRETISNPAFIQSFFMVGILGGFTTFSAFSIGARSASVWQSSSSGNLCSIFCCIFNSGSLSWLYFS